MPTIPTTIFVLSLLFGTLATDAAAQWRLVGPDSTRRLDAIEGRMMVQVAEGAAGLDAASLGVPDAAIEAHALPGWFTIEATQDAEVRARLLATGLLRFATPVFLDDLGGLLFPTRNIIVVLDDPRIEGLVLERLHQLGGGSVLARNWENLDGAFLIEARSRDGGRVLEIAAELAALDGVRFAEPDLCFSGSKLHQPNDARFFEMWGYHNGLQLGFAVSDIDMDAPEAWDLTRGNPAIRVAVLDDGVQHDHPDMPYGLVGADTTSEGPGDGSPVNVFDNHGTSVAGLIVGRMDNAFGIAGLAPECSLHTVRCYVSTSITGFITMSSWTVAALSYCENAGIRITNNSVVLGAQPAATTLKYDTTAANGMIHYAAAGNSPAQGTRYPANLASVRGLVGLQYDGQLASFSASGPDMDYAGPADQVLTCDRSGAEGYLNPADFVYQQGTSFATASASALGALVLGVNPALTDVQVHEIIAASCMDLGAPGFDSAFAHGMMNAFGAVWRAALTRGDPETLIWMQTAAQSASSQGAAVAGLGDVNGDGLLDFAIGAPDHDGTAGTDCGRIELRSGATGQTLWSIEGGSAGERFGAALAGLGDLNADGIPDLAVGAPATMIAGMIDAGRVTILSGADGTFVRSFDGTAANELFGSSLAAMGDLGGDGVDDLAIGAPKATVGMTAGVGRVAIVSGQDGTIISGATGDEIGGELGFGFALARIADRDGDLLPDLLVGAPESLYGGTDSGGLVLIRSQNGSRLGTIQGTTPNDRLGHAVCTWGDQTGDGIEDYVAGAPGFAAIAGPDGGAAVVFSGQSLAPVLAYFGKNAGDRQGEALCQSIDIDGDSVGDLVIGAPGHDGATMTDIGKIEVWSSASIRPRYSLVGGKSGQRFGAALAALGDIDGDSRGEVLVGAPGDMNLVAGFSAVLPAPNPAALGPLPADIADGSLGGSGSGPYDLFFTNESAGGVDRTVNVAIGQNLNYSMLQPLANPNPANFALFAYLGIPPSYLEYTLPLGIGEVLWLPCTVTPANPIGFLVTNSTGLDPCPQLVASLPTPWRYTHVGGIPFPLTVTFYGVVEETPTTLAVTNALILKIQ